MEHSGNKRERERERMGGRGREIGRKRDNFNNKQDTVTPKYYIMDTSLIRTSHQSRHLTNPDTSLIRTTYISAWAHLILHNKYL